MKKRISLIILFIISLLFVGILSSCDKEEIDEDKIKITFYARHFEDWSDEFTQKVVKEFNEIPDNDIYVDLKIYESDTYNDALVIARENGKSPEIFMSSYSSLPHDARQENVAALNSLFDQEIWDDIDANILEFVTFDNKIYGFPWFSEPGSIFYYRKDILQQYGYNEAPKTFDELYAICADIKKDLKIGQYALGLPASPSDLAWATWGLQYNLSNGLVVTDDWLTSRIEDNGYKELAKFFYTCAYNKYCNTSNISTDGYTNITEALFAGNIMMCWGGSWQIALLHTLAEENNNDEIIKNIGVSEIPTLTGDKNKTTAANGGWCYSISSTTSVTKRQAAVKFIKWLFTEDPKRLGKYFEASYMSRKPASKKVQNYLKTVDTVVDPQWVETVNNVSNYAIPEAYYPWDLSFEVANFIQACVQTSSTSFESVYSSALSNAKNNIQSIMSRDSYTRNPWMVYDE